MRVCDFVIAGPLPVGLWAYRNVLDEDTGLAMIVKNSFYKVKGELS